MTDKDKKIIEDAEREGIPIFVLTAKDAISLEVLSYYFDKCGRACNINHVEAVGDRLFEFSEWQVNNKDKVKLPD